MRQATRALLLATAAAAALAAPGARAAELGPAQVAALAGNCAACHGPDGRSPGPVPALAGRPEDYLRGRLAAFRTDQAPGTTVMGRIAKGFSDEELDALARHFAAVKD